MPITGSPGTLIIPSRDETRELYLRSFRVRNPSALTTENTFPWIDASCQADLMQVLYRDAVVTNAGILLSTATGAAVDQRLADLGLSRLSSVGSSGYVFCDASVGGTTIFQGDELKQLSTGLRFQCSVTALYLDGDEIPIAGIDIGEQTNVDGGTILTWSAPRPGCGSTATVVTQADGESGLTGGHGIEGDDDAIKRAISIRANPPASGNDAEYQADVADTPAIAIQQAFTYPCIRGPGTMGVCFTIRNTTPGASRIPNGAQISSALANLVGQMPADDQIFIGIISAINLDIVFKVTWAVGSPSWTDAAPWPAYYAPAGQAIIVQAATDATNFILKCQNNVYTAVAQPAVGQTFGFYDGPARVFRRKKVLSFTGTGPWTIVCDTANAASDTSYVPIVGQRASPWSDSLDNIPPAVVSYCDGLGPGEQVASFFDAGLRMRRSPVSPGSYPHQISNRIVTPVLDLDAIQDAELIEPTVPHSTTVGTPGVNSYMQVLRYLDVFPQP
jgi:uncharacterized phage protein gp47/JayE